MAMCCGCALRSILRNPLLAVGAGAALAICLQSATAVALIVGSFAGSGIVGGTAGLLAVLGADVGSSLVVKLLSFDLEVLVPICLVAGTALFMATSRRDLLQLGRILIGIGLLILSLRLIGEASEPLRQSQILPVVVNYLSGDPVTAFLLAAVMTWLFHSSVAAILLVVALAARGLVPVELGVVLVLGANIGGGIIAVMLSRAAPHKARIVPLGNLIMRGTGALIALIAVIWFAAAACHARSDRARAARPRAYRLQHRAGARRHAASPAWSTGSPNASRWSTRPIAGRRPRRPPNSPRSPKPRSTRLPRRSPTPRAKWCASARPSRSC